MKSPETSFHEDNSMPYFMKNSTEVPKKLQGLTPQEAEELTKYRPIYNDPKKNEQESQRRDKALKAIGEKDKNELNQIRSKIDRSGDENIRDLDEYSKFKVKNGETDTGVWWNEYSNLAAKHLKESGQFEWGKERIYFDIPLSDMEKMRDLVFEASKEGKIPIAFKYLDTNKTNQIDLESNSETTRFVANFSSTEDAKKFYNILKKSEKYQSIKSDRNLDYHGYQLDKIAHYASGYREKRMSLAQIIKTARLNPDGSYTYRGLFQGNDGKWYQGKEKNMPKAMLDNFKAQFAAMPNPKDNWENAKIS